MGHLREGDRRSIGFSKRDRQPKGKAVRSCRILRWSGEIGEDMGRKDPEVERRGE